MTKDIILFVGYFISADSVVQEIKEHFGKDNIRIGLIFNSAGDVNDIIKRKIKASSEVSDIVLSCDMSSLTEIKTTLGPYLEQIAGITTRGESFLEEFKNVIRIMPEDILTPTVEAIDNTSDKSLMRNALSEFSKDLVPRYQQVKDGNDETLEEIAEYIKFPLILKPSGLSTSMLVTKCMNMEELKQSSANIFSVIEKRYKKFKGEDLQWY